MPARHGTIPQGCRERDHPDQHGHRQGREADQGRRRRVKSRSPRTGRPPTSSTLTRARSPRSAPPPTRAGKPIHVGRSRDLGPEFIAITPDGKTAYVANTGLNTVIPISTATNTRRQADPRRPRPGLDRDHPGREDRLRRQRDPQRVAVRHGHPDQHGHQHPRQADPGRPRPVRDRDHPGRQDRLRRQRVQRHADQHRHQHGRPADPPRRQPRRGLYRDHPGRQDRLRHHREPVARSSRSARPPTRPGTRSRSPPTRPSAAHTRGSSRSPRTGRPPTSCRTDTDTVIPISTATNTAGQPIRFGSDCHAQPLVWPGLSIAITPDGKTAYFACESAVIPISTATNTPGKPIPIPLRDPMTIAITP